MSSRTITGMRELPLVRVQIAGNRHPNWIHISGEETRQNVTEMARYRQRT